MSSRIQPPAGRQLPSHEQEAIPITAHKNSITTCIQPEPSIVVRGTADKRNKKYICSGSKVCEFVCLCFRSTGKYFRAKSSGSKSSWGAPFPVMLMVALWSSDLILHIWRDVNICFPEQCSSYTCAWAVPAITQEQDCCCLARKIGNIQQF